MQEMQREILPLTLEILRVARARGLWCVAHSEGTHSLTTVDANGNEFHILVSLVAEDEIDFMISYRWREMYTIAENGGPIAVNFVGASAGKGRCWVDVLNHLNDDELKGQVLEKMGSLYAGIKTIAEYFNYSPATVKDVFLLVAEASRGWMWQEVALGPGVESFGSRTAELCFAVIRLGRDKWEDERLLEDACATAMVNALRWCISSGQLVREALDVDHPSMERFWAQRKQPGSDLGFECLLAVPEQTVALVAALAKERGEVERALMSAAGNLENGNIGADLEHAASVVKPDLREASLGVIASKYAAELGAGEEGKLTLDERMDVVLTKMRSLLVFNCVRGGQSMTYRPVPCGDSRITDLFGFGVERVRFIEEAELGPEGDLNGGSCKVVLLGERGIPLGEEQMCDVSMELCSVGFQVENSWIGAEQTVVSIHVNIHSPADKHGNAHAVATKVVLESGLVLTLQRACREIELAVPKESAADLHWRTKIPLTLNGLREARNRGLWCVAHSEGTHSLTTVDANGNEFHILVSLVAEDEIDFMISYRWREMYTIAENGGPIAVNFVGASAGKGRCWVDVLNHLNDDELKGQVLEKMGSLYAGIKTIAEYFNYSPATVKDVFLLVAEASRGWMWQEVALGPGVESFGSRTAELCFAVIRLGRDKWEDERLLEDACATAMVNVIRVINTLGANLQLAFMAPADHSIWTDTLKQPGSDLGFECLLAVPEQTVALVAALAKERGEVERALMSAAGNLENGNIGADLEHAASIVKPDLREASLGVIASKYAAELGAGEEGKLTLDERMDVVLTKMRSLLVFNCVRGGQSMTYRPVPCGDSRITDLFGFGVERVRFIEEAEPGPDGGTVGATWRVSLERSGCGQVVREIALSTYSAFFDVEDPSEGEEHSVATCFVQLFPLMGNTNRGVRLLLTRVILASGVGLDFKETMAPLTKEMILS